MTAILQINDQYGLGRKQATDPRDQQHLMRSLLPRQMPTVKRRNWTCGDVLDQGSTPRCVGHAWYGLLLATPMADLAEPYISPSNMATHIWAEAQKVDEWPGEDPDDGTSVRAGAKVLSDPTNLIVNSQGKAQVKRYLWADDLETMVIWLLTHGPIVVGFDWFGDMFRPDPLGIVHATGNLEGGHAFLYRAADVETRMFRFRNSWGHDWGKDGDAFISFEDTALLLSRQGEACTAVEQLRVP
jgi:hypothetical protein